MEPTIRLADVTDTAAIRACVHDAFGPYVSRIGTPPRPMLLDFESHVREGQVWVAVVDREIAGVLVQYDTPDGFYIDTVASHSRFRGTGVGKALLMFAEHEAVRRGFDSVYLCTNAKMFENQVLYPKVGYVEYERKHAEGHERIYYRKVL
jgi:GNAT superfamily N-acetyltransferase